MPGRFGAEGGNVSFEEAFAEMAALGKQGTEIDGFDGTLADGLPEDDYGPSRRPGGDGG
jgi:hypothetical protein